DPSGNRIELVWRPAHSGVRYHGARDAGVTDFSHVGLCTTDAARDEAFWTQVCNARVSDRVGEAPLLRINEVHHSIALFPTDRAGIQHINHQVESADDVMRSFRFLSERQIRIVFGPGRHPSSSAKFLYFEGPDGMVFEYSSGVKMIADELLYRERQLAFAPAGFCEWGAKPEVTEFLSLRDDLPQRRGDVAAVDRGHVAGGLEFERLMQERLRHVLGGDLAAEQVAGHVVLLTQATRFGALRDHLRREQAGADAV